MNQRDHLDVNLKRLKLSGMLLNLDMRLQEAGENDLSYFDFLTILVQDEMLQRENNIFLKRLKAARFGTEKTFEDFNFKFNEDVIPAKMLRELATCRFIDLKENIVIVGPPGIGKTHIAKAIGHEACRRCCNVLFKKAHQLLEELLNAKTFGKYESMFKKYVNVHLLLLDDFAFRKLDGKEAEVLYALIDERIGTGSTIVTSNRPPQDWINVFPDMVMGGAILDRLVSGAHKIIVKKEAKSYRKEGEKFKKSIDKGVEKA